LIRLRIARSASPNWLAGCFALLVAGCSVRRGALAPASPEVTEVAHLFELFTWVSIVIFLVVVAALVVAVGRGLKRHDPSPELSRDGSIERRLQHAVTASTVVSVLILVGLLVSSVASGHKLNELEGEPVLHVEVTAHQWWWEIRYPQDRADHLVITANELHVPAGRPIEVTLRSADVIHSFWVPRLFGKRDMIPSHVTKVTFRADAPGVYAGRCAEFCGLEHARMDLLVVADLPSAFDRWIVNQRASAVASEDEAAHRGQTVFLRGTCAMCHTVSGTPARGNVGPDLTHFASRKSLAAGTGPVDPPHVTDWLAHTQRLKPGAQMPQVPLSSTDTSDLVSYLIGLQ
jgi:cytochrome c oxidase subunit 2